MLHATMQAHFIRLVYSLLDELGPVDPQAGLKANKATHRTQVSHIVLEAGR